jgi:hypothetical protein
MEEHMTQRIRTLLLALGMAVAFAGGAWRVQAQAEKHPVLRNSIHQLEGIKDRLQKAPSTLVVIRRRRLRPSTER